MTCICIMHLFTGGGFYNQHGIHFLFNMKRFKIKLKKKIIYTYITICPGPIYRLQYAQILYKDYNMFRLYRLQCAQIIYIDYNMFRLYRLQCAQILYIDYNVLRSYI